MREDEPDHDKASKLIGADVSLAAAKLKAVNSACFGLRTKATSVNQALQLTGLRNTVEIVTGLLLRQAFPVGDNAARETFWHTSSGIAEVTARLARPLDIKNRDEVEEFGLDHASLGPTIAQGWSLPGEIYLAILNHRESPLHPPHRSSFTFDVTPFRNRSYKLRQSIVRRRKRV